MMMDTGFDQGFRRLVLLLSSLSLDPRKRQSFLLCTTSVNVAFAIGTKFARYQSF